MSGQYFHQLPYSSILSKGRLALAKRQAEVISNHLTTANEAVCMLLALQRMRCHKHMHTDLRWLVLRIDWFARAEDRRQSGQSRDKLFFTRTARDDEEEILKRTRICMKRVENYFGKPTLSTPNRDSSLDLTVIGSLVYSETSALDYVVTEEGSAL
uniref:Uncharacterized protein n=1 Tax=Timema tahoe TaxID=61484 RepID=A0A7R9P007_9NEOP|nr:unnamed protein product [Timema tahoe]